MNDNNLNQNGGTYKATANLNTAIDNPQINVNSATGVNVQDLGYNNYVESTNVGNNNPINSSSNFGGNTNDLSYINSGSNTNTNTNTNISTNSNSIVDTNIETDVGSDSSNISDTNNSIDDTSNVNYTYAPTLEEKKIKQESIISILFHSKEFKALILIVFILCLFLLVMPSLYDLIRKIQLMR